MNRSSRSVTEQQRFPLITAAGREILDRLRQHRAAPRYTYHCGEKLSQPGLDRVRDLGRHLQERPTRWTATTMPEWLSEYVAGCYADVPFYRQQNDFGVERIIAELRASNIAAFAEIPPLVRRDLQLQPWLFVPDSQSLDELVVYSTSGTTGNFLQIICNPDAPVSYLPLMEFALAKHDVSIDGGSRVSIMHVAAQQSTFTHCSVMSYFDFAGFVKVNLHPHEWTHPDDRVRFIDDCDPEIYTGDPFAFVELSKLDLKTRPKAIISSATQLSPGTRTQLEARFGCPVIDMISLNETGPIAFSLGDRHCLFSHQLYVEILNNDGKPVAPGQRGEITVTGGVNSMMPLLRYRTGDFAALVFEGDQPFLTNFCGRTPIRFVRDDGQIVRSIDIVVKLYRVPLPMFRLHQHANGKLLFQTRCDSQTEQGLLRLLTELFDPTSLQIQQLPDDEVWSGKSIQFSSDFDNSGSHVLD